MLLSFERPAASPAGAFPRTLKTAQQCQHQRPFSERARYGYHRAQPDPPRAEPEKA
jgi:hypothetical protein